MTAMVEPTVTLQEYLEKVCCVRMGALSERILAHMREHELMAEALGKAEAAVNQRLGAMNELRDQINTERSAYATKEYLRAEVRPIASSIETVQRSMSNMEGRAWALAIVLPLVVSAIVSLALKFL